MIGGRQTTAAAIQAVNRQAAVAAVALDPIGITGLVVVVPVEDIRQRVLNLPPPAHRVVIGIGVLALVLLPVEQVVLGTVAIVCQIPIIPTPLQAKKARKQHAELVAEPVPAG